MSYETDPAGLGVGKRYGPLGLGGMQGAMRGADGVTTAVFEITFDELDASAAQAITVPPYSRIIATYVEVEEVFGTGDTFAPELNGTLITSAVIPVSALGNLVVANSVTDADLTTGATAETLLMDVALIDAGTPLTGKAKCIVQYVAI